MKISTLFNARPRRRQVRSYSNSMEAFEERVVMSAANPVAAEVAMSNNTDAPDQVVVDLTEAFNQFTAEDLKI